MTLDPAEATSRMTFAATPSTDTVPETEVGLGARAAQLVCEKRGAEAIALLRDAGTGEGISAQAWEGLADLLWYHGDMAGAEAAYREVLSRAPRNDAALVRLSMLLEWRAEREAAKALLLGDGSATLSGAVAARLGFLRLGERDHLGAETVLRYATTQEGAPTSAWRDLSDALVHLGRRAEAMAIARDGIARWPEDPGAQAWLGHLLIDAGKHEEALGYLRLSLATGAAPSYARMRHAEALYRSGNPEASVEEARRTLEEQPGNPAVTGHIGYLMVQCGQVEYGARLLTEAIAALPDSPDLRLLHSAAFFDCGRIPDAVAAARAAAEALAENADILDRYGHVLLAAEDPVTAATVFDRVIAINPGHIRAWTGYCEAERRCKRFKTAIAAFRKLSELGADADTIRTQRYRLFGEMT